MRLATVPALLAVMVLSTQGRFAGAEAKGPRKLEGEWVLRSTADKKRISPGSKDCKMVIGADGRVALKLGARTTNQGTARLRRCDKAHLVDLKLETGLFLGVYELKGDDLVICFDEAGKPRPTGLQPKGSQWVERWQRAGKAGRREPGRCGK
jgi:uncharacterized protein (TIGR03067 family)